MTTAKPSLGLLRSLTDEHVLRALMGEPRLTRAELSVVTSLSKPTISDSVRRLVEAGMLRDTGERTTGRGRVGSYYALSDRLGSALAVSLAPEGVVVEAVDVRGQVLTRVIRPVARPATAEVVGQALAAAVRDVVGQASQAPVRLAVVSAADPVDRMTGRLVHLPDAPFLLGELSPADILHPYVAGPVTVDNDVNWAARAERAESPVPMDDIVYLYLGEGLGCAVVSCGTVLRGHRGIAGEIGHLVVRGPGGQAVHLTDVFAQLGLRLPGSTAIDLDAMARLLLGRHRRDRDTLAALAAATCDVIAAARALTDPESMVLGGPWGAHPAFQAAVRDELVRRELTIAVRPPVVTHEPSLAAARRWAVAELRGAVLAEATGGSS